jgi:hypothetical protein
MKNREELVARHSPHLFQATLFRLTPEEFIAEAFVSADEMVTWHRRGWLSFDPNTLLEYDQKEHAEVMFIRGLARSGLSDALIGRMLCGLERPYCYDSSATFFSFADNRWISLPPTEEPADVTIEYLNALVEAKDWDTIRELQATISKALEDAEDVNQ